MTAARFRPTLAELWTFLAIALPTLAALLAPMPAVDLAYQLRAGGQILDTGAIPAVDTWTFTIQGQPWLDQQWGAQVLLALVFRLMGWGGLAVLRAGLVALTFGLLLLVVRRRNPSLAPRWQALLVLVAFLVAATSLALRPQLFAIVLFAATLLILADRRAHPKRIWLIPILAIAWVNLHGSFPLVLVLLGLAVLGDLLDRGEWRISLTATVVTALATLVNPFVLDVWGYVVRLATNPTIGSRVSEWRPPSFSDGPGLLFWASLLGATVAVAALWRASGWGRRGGSFPIPALLTLVAFAGFGALTGRGLAWWPLAAVFVLSGFIPAGPTAPAGSTPALERMPSRLNGLVMGLVVVAGVALLPFWRPTGPAGVPIGTLAYAPQGITSYWRETMGCVVAPNAPNPASPAPVISAPRSCVPVWVPQHWGSWFELDLPAANVAVDSRVELFPASAWADYDTVESGTGDWQSILDRYNVNWVVTEAVVDHPLEAALRASGIWAPYYSDGEGTIWSKP